VNYFRSIKVWPAILLLGASTCLARADGGIISFRGVAGSYVITIFTSATPVRNKFTDISVLVQKADSNDPILDAIVNLVFTAPSVPQGEPICGLAGIDSQINVSATHQQASNKLLYAAPVKFSATGHWRLQAVVERRGETAEVTCDIPVGSPPRRLAGLFPCLALPPLLVGLFAINQGLRKRSSDKQL
jgi:hypothetical protein